MKPYPARDLDDEKRVYNYRLSRARRIVENAFGILASRFGVFQKPIPLCPEKVEVLVLAACVLHNFLRSRSSSESIYSPPGTFDSEISGTSDIIAGEWRTTPEPRGMIPLARQGGNRSTADAQSIRDELKDYFNARDPLPWQWNFN